MNGERDFQMPICNSYEIWTFLTIKFHVVVVRVSNSKKRALSLKQRSIICEMLVVILFEQPHRIDNFFLLEYSFKRSRFSYTNTFLPSFHEFILQLLHSANFCMNDPRLDSPLSITKWKNQIKNNPKISTQGKNQNNFKNHAKSRLSKSVYLRKPIQKLASFLTNDYIIKLGFSLRWS